MNVAMRHIRKPNHVGVYRRVASQESIHQITDEAKRKTSERSISALQENNHQLKPKLLAIPGPRGFCKRRCVASTGVSNSHVLVL